MEGTRLPEHIMRRRISAFVAIGCSLEMAREYASTQAADRRRGFKSITNNNTNR